MRTVRIDFNKENMLPDGDLAGRIGEHNATHLAISPTEEMSACNEIVSYLAAFVTEGRIIRSNFYSKADQITVPLCLQLTQGHTLGVQLEGYDGKGTLLVKSPVALLKFLPSAGGDETDYESENGGLVSQINLNTLSRHSHENASVLDNLGESGGTLTYNGEAIKGGSNIRTAEFFLSDDTATFYSKQGTTFTSGENRYISMQILGCFMNPVKELPCGTKIENLEIKLSEDSEYISFDSLCAESSFRPVLKMNDNIFSSVYGNCFFSGLCVFGYNGTTWKSIVDDWEWYSVRISYRAVTEDK